MRRNLLAGLFFLISLAPLLRVTADTLDGWEQSIVIGITWDRSGSFSEFPPPDSLEFCSLIDAVSARKGHIGFLTIRNTSFHPLLRRSFSIDTVAIEGLRLSARVAAVEYNDSVKTDYYAERDRYVGEVLAIIRSTKTTKSTDIFGALDRLSMMFSEPNFGKSIRILLVVSDSKHTAENTAYDYPEANIFVIGSTYRQAKQIFTSPTCFESFSSAIEYICSLYRTSRGISNDSSHLVRQIERLN